MYLSILAFSSGSLIEVYILEQSQVCCPASGGLNFIASIRLICLLTALLLMATQLRCVYIPTPLNVSRHKFSETVVMAVSALVIQIDNCVVLTVPDRARKRWSPPLCIFITTPNFGNLGLNL